MFPTPYLEIIAIFTEIVGRLSPAVIKGIDADVNTMILIEMLVSITIAFLILSPNDYKTITKISYSNLLHSFLLGGLSFFTAKLNYFAYKELPVAISMLVRCLFPVFLVIIYFFAGFEQPLEYAPFFIGFFVLMVYILKPKPHHVEKFKNLEDNKKIDKYKAVAALSLSALLGCIGHTLKKIGIDSHETHIIRTKIFALLLSMSFFIINSKLPEMRTDVWVKLIIYYILLGSVISKIRSITFFSVPEIYYAIFIFIGTTVSYLISEYIPTLVKSDPVDFKLKEKNR